MEYNCWFCVFTFVVHLMSSYKDLNITVMLIPRDLTITVDELL